MKHKYYGVKQTSQRLFDFAAALAGDDVDKMKEMQKAMEKGFTYTMEKDAALQYLRDVLSTWQYKLMEIYGRSTREEEMQGFTDKYEKWRVHLKDSVGKVEWYDEETERNADYRPKDIIRPEDVFRPIANIKNITAKNIKDVLYAQSLVKLLEESDWQRLV